MTLSLLIIPAVLIVVALASYATYLLLQLRKQNQAKAKAEADYQQQLKEKQNSVIADIRYIAAAMLEDRCELSEGVMRIARLFEVALLTERVSNHYPNLYTHFECIKDHPIKEQRKALAKQERMKLDLARMKSETALEAPILKEAESLQHFELAKFSH
ncbi:DUF2489 domain-containing protein [Parashewanella curva]|uniref:DUF2489 domain-containing protein n=1 Tax=Parashewanella curva TaxID=2338552 RepID=A0A3L8PRN1_9GAMM|nr:DUF2489 domain-containing protein [Parashewanella curva]RLV58067.1 DUF2489 domain-containing protein [Parashewanella curva]